MSEAFVLGRTPEAVKMAVESKALEPIMGMPIEEFVELSQSVYVMVPHRQDEGVSASLMINTGYWAGYGTAVSPIEDQFGGFIEQTRCNMAKLFRQVRSDNPRLKYLVMIDNDQAVPWDAPYKLAAWDLPIVSGIVPSYAQGRGIYANIFIKDEFNVPRMPSYNRTGKIPGKGLKECHSVGAGLVCIRHDVIDKIIEDGELPFVMTPEDRQSCFDTGVLRVGEDTTFCAQARARGFKCFADFSVRATHFKTLALEWPQSHVDYSIDVRDWKVDPGDYHHA